MELDIFLEFIADSINEIISDIEKLYSDKNNNKRKILNRLSSEAMMLDNYIKHFRKSNRLNEQEMTDLYVRNYMPQIQPVVKEMNTFTKEELAKYDGKNGNHAYVAVNGIVYNVTNNAAWAAATHFGLSSGKDLTTQFASCHAGADILSRLPAVGTLV